MAIRHLKIVALVAASSLAIAGCVGSFDPANPRQVSASERQQGAQAHEQILAEFGGAYNGPGSAMVERVGKEVAIASGLTATGQECTVTLLDSQVVNAFAIPGCYTYVTRGLLSIMENEAQLASVLGHEIGHVAAEHSKRRQNRALFSNLAAIGLGILTGSGQVAQAATQIAQVTTLKYSRDQEYESDDLGIRYMAAAGYDPYESADVLDALGDQSALDARIRGRDEAAQVPAWARSHPLSSDRVKRADRKASETGLQRGAQSQHTERFMSSIDGMLYGDSPSQGYVDKHSFAHPQLRLGFRVPDGYYLNNSARAVTATSGNSKTQIQFSGGRLQSGGSISNHVDQVINGILGNARANAQFSDTRTSTINGMSAATRQARVSAQGGQVDLTVVGYKFDADSAYHFVFISPANVDDANIVRSTSQSFRKLSTAEAARLRPKIIDVVTVKRGDTVSGLARRMAFDDYKVERFRVLNDLDDGQTLRAGQQVKIVVNG
ncbi:M48 family metalloprotease [Pacificimonas sp. WHA3]|uniref:M48 family metalloprotease n=1 Tax=Pacificimonas pallii TaxID=2827236 RepID=A0ABS6SHD6_9SPHN|nr:M48 family metalloprotease [Pacificimonas pallii]MBV7257833.1 M48 family metalloprotease [Pacificimonas pallii]